MRVNRITGLVATALASCAVAATSAWAAGPSWTTAAGTLEVGEAAKATTAGLGDFTFLKAALGASVMCKGLSAPTTLLGGTPGRADTEVALSECTVEGYEKCDALSVGETVGKIAYKAREELVYTGTEKEAEKEEGPLGILLTGEEEGGKGFTTIEFETLEAGTCPTGAAVTEVKGGVIAETTPVNELSKQDMLTLPSTAIEKGWRWKRAGEVEEVTPTLANLFGKATQIGLADIELESGESFGPLLSGVFRKCKTNDGEWVFCSGGAEFGNGTPAKPVKGSSGGTTVLQGVIKGLATEVQCTKGTLEGTLESEGVLTGADKLEGCSVIEPAGGCKISSGKITAEPAARLEGPVPGGPPELRLSAMVATVDISGCKAVKGNWALTGEQKCGVDAEYETERAEHEIVCEKAESKLKMDGEAASLSMTLKTSLKEGGNWSMQVS